MGNTPFRMSVSKMAQEDHAGMSVDAMAAVGGYTLMVDNEDNMGVAEAARTNTGI